MYLIIIFFTGSQQQLDTFCGSPPYAAPELFSDDHYIGEPVDVWALGVLVYFMIVGNMPFRAPTVPALRAAVLKGDFLLPASLSLPATRLIRKQSFLKNLINNNLHLFFVLIQSEFWFTLLHAGLLSTKC